LGYGLEDPVFEPVGEGTFIFSKSSEMALEPTQSPVQSVTKLFAGSKTADCGFGHSFPFIAEVKNEWRYTTINLISLDWCFLLICSRMCSGSFLTQCKLIL
jgi:hypothetical protein